MGLFGKKDPKKQRSDKINNFAAGIQAGDYDLYYDGEKNAIELLKEINSAQAEIDSDKWEQDSVDQWLKPMAELAAEGVTEKELQRALDYHDPKMLEEVAKENAALDAKEAAENELSPEPKKNEPNWLQELISKL